MRRIHRLRLMPGLPISPLEEIALGFVNWADWTTDSWSTKVESLIKHDMIFCPSSKCFASTTWDFQVDEQQQRDKKKIGNVLHFKCEWRPKVGGIAILVEFYLNLFETHRTVQLKTSTRRDYGFVYRSRIAWHRLMWNTLVRCRCCDCMVSFLGCAVFTVLCTYYQAICH